MYESYIAPLTYSQQTRRVQQTNLSVAGFKGSAMAVRLTSSRVRLRFLGFAFLATPAERARFSIQIRQAQIVLSDSLAVNDRRFYRWIPAILVGRG
jgi:hypothetical protein